MLKEKIYKAIQKGLNEALANLSIDDFDDVETNSELDQEKEDIETWSGTEEHKIWSDYIDLGLPSGTKWCKYNLGATCANTPESWYGDYYMWGSTKPNTFDICTWRNMPFNNGNSEFDETYFYSIKDQVINGRSLYPEYDAATMVYDHSKMPSYKHVIELITCTSRRCVKDYNGVMGLNGVMFTGPNGKSIFIPAGGRKNVNRVLNDTYSCYIWTSDIFATAPFMSYYLEASGADSYAMCSLDKHEIPRCNGLPIRAIIEK